MKKYIVNFELEVTADLPSAAIRAAHRRLMEVIESQSKAGPAWDVSFVPEKGSAHMTGAPRIGRVAGWRCVTHVKEKDWQ